MEETSADDPASAQARERFRANMVRLGTFVTKQSDPKTAEDRSMIPPHQANKY